MQSILRFKLFFQAGLVAAAVLICKILADHFGLSVISINTLTGTFFGGVFFTISIVFTGAMADFKEAEKIPSEMAVILKAIRTDSGLISPAEPACNLTGNIVCHAEQLLYAIADNLRHNHWRKSEINAYIDLLNTDIAGLLTRGAAASIPLKLRDNLTNLDRLSHRLDYIAYTNDIPGAYVVCDFALAAVLLIFVFARNEWGLGGLVLFASIAFVLTSIVRLIHDMDNPFEYGGRTVADVDLSAIFDLEASWKNGSS